MKVLLTGVSGLAGRYILNHPLRPRGAEIVGTSRREHSHPDFETIDYRPLPFDRAEDYGRLIDIFRPDVIAHLGGEANVDTVEKNPEASLVSNLEFPLYLMKKAKDVGARIVQFSSNAVYDGERAPYHEGSPAGPLNTYGKLKAEVDAATRRFDGEWLILRPIVMYGWNYSFGRNNPVSQFVPMLEAGKQIRMVTDQFENPVYARDVAEVFWRSLLAGANGEFNLGGGDPGLSRHDWISMVAKELGVSPELVQKASINDFTLPARRPRDTRFDVSRLGTELNFRPATAREGLKSMLLERASLAPSEKKAA